MFSRWGAFVYRFRRPIAILTLVARHRRTRLGAPGVRRS